MINQQVIIIRWYMVIIKDFLKSVEVLFSVEYIIPPLVINGVESSIWFSRLWGSFSWIDIVWYKVYMGEGSRQSSKIFGFKILSISLWKGGHSTHSGQMRPHFCYALMKTSVLCLLFSWRRRKISDRGWNWCFISNQLKLDNIFCDWL